MRGIHRRAEGGGHGPRPRAGVHGARGRRAGPRPRRGHLHVRRRRHADAEAAAVPERGPHLHDRDAIDGQAPDDYDNSMLPRDCAQGARGRGRPLRGLRRHLYRHHLPHRRRPGGALRRRLRRRPHFRRDRRRARARAHHPPARHDRGRGAGRRPVARALDRAIRRRSGGHRPHGARERQVVRGHRRDAEGLYLPVRAPRSGSRTSRTRCRRPRDEAVDVQVFGRLAAGRHRRRRAAGTRAGRRGDQGGSRAAEVQRPLRAASRSPAASSATASRSSRRCWSRSASCC